MRYPRVNGKPMDSLRKAEFTEVRHFIADELRNSAAICKHELPKRVVDTAAWNVAFLVVTR